MNKGKKTSEIRKRKVIAYYFLAIVVPCVILGILAFRGIRNDQALIEREQRREVQEITNSISVSLDRRLDAIEKDFHDVEYVQQHLSIFNNRALDSLLNNLPEVAGILIISDDNNVSILDHDLAYFPDQMPLLATAPISSQGRLVLEKGWAYEYQQKYYNKAIQYYQGIFEKSKDNNLRGEILHAVARIQKKQHDVEGAIATYQRISLDYSDVYIQGKISLGLTALQERATLDLSKGDTLQFLKTINVLLVDLKNRKWTLKQAYFQFAIDEVSNALDQIRYKLNSPLTQLLDDNTSLLDSLKVNALKTRYLLQIINEGTSFNSMLGLNDTAKRSMIQRDGHDYLLSLLRINNSMALGIIYDLEYVQVSIETQIRKSVDPSDASWKIFTQGGEELAASGVISDDQIPVTAALPPHLPSWTLVFFPIEKGLMSSFLQTSGGIYFYIFIIILIILSLGLIFILHTVRTEIKLSKMKSNFMSTVSHEFKSPLASIRQMSEMLEQNRVPDPARKQYYYSAILQQSERLTHLIENILDFSRMEENQKIFRFEKDDIVRLVEDVVQYFQNLMEGKGFTIELKCTDQIPEFEFDSEAMEQVLHNLMDNACKFSGEAKKVHVKIKRHQKQVSISIRDYGIGILNEDQDKIFNRFYRAGDSLTQNVKGSGIGLTIVKQIIEAHKGQIKVESTPGNGSIFTITVPLVIKASA